MESGGWVAERHLAILSLSNEWDSSVMSLGFVLSLWQDPE